MATQGYCQTTELTLLTYCFFLLMAISTGSKGDHLLCLSPNGATEFKAFSFEGTPFLMAPLIS